MTTDPALLEIAIHIAREAGSLARKRRTEGVRVAAHKSSEVDIVTAADREVEQLIRNRLAELRPQDGFFGEESGAETGTSGLTWLVDPIDGTVNYFYGIPHYAVSIAVVAGEPEPQLWQARSGVVFNPVTDELFTARVHGGAWLNGVPIRANQRMNPAQALVGTGFGYHPQTRVGQAQVVRDLLAEVRDIRRMGAASLDLCAVACGRLDAYFEQGLQPWDYAAGALIAAEAGASVGGVAGAAPSAQLVLAGDPDVTALIERKLIASAPEAEPPSSSKAASAALMA